MVPVQGAIEIVGPRPRISAVRTSFPPAGIELREDEIPAGSMVSFAISVQNVEASGARVKVYPMCSARQGREESLVLTPGQRTEHARLELAGASGLFLSINPAAIGPSGCRLGFAVSAEVVGESAPWVAGRILRAPRIERFTLTEEILGESMYAGLLEGYDLDTIEKTGWNAETGWPVQAIATPLAGSSGKQQLKVALAWPSPAPHAPVFVWLAGEPRGRSTGVKY
jgi:hypothetical protein